MPIVGLPDANDYIASTHQAPAKADREGNLLVLESGAIKAVTLDKTAAALAASEAFVLIDLSDTTNFPHKHTGRIRLHGFDLHFEKDTDATFLVKIGVVTEVDATDGSVAWLWVFRLHTDREGTDSTDWREIERRFPGLDLEVDTVNDKLFNMLSNTNDAADATWQTDVTLDSPRGDTTVAPGVGDLVMEITRTAGNLYFCMTPYYRTDIATP